MILTAARRDLYGFITHPELCHLFADDFFAWLARLDGALQDGRHIVFDHQNPCFGRREPDSIDRAAYSPTMWEQDARTFGRIKEAFTAFMRGPPTGETLQIHVPICNRFRLGRESVRNLVETAPPEAEIHVWIDGRYTREETGWPRGVHCVHAVPRIGIEPMRGLHIDHFLRNPADWLYFTDADAVHAPNWFPILRRLVLETGRLASGYRTHAHDADLVRDCWRYLHHAYTAGISMLMSRDQVFALEPFLTDPPERRFRKHPSRPDGFDWAIPQILGGASVVAESLVEHIGEGGIHHPQDGRPPDTAINPAPGLRETAASLEHLAKRG
jgi:hypothetical protein